MYMNSVFVILLISIASSNAECPNKCKCSFTAGLTVDCSNGGLTEIPKLDGNEANVTRFLLQNNRIRKIDNIKHLKNLTTLQLSNNLITVINGDEFPDENYIANLDVSTNRLSGISNLAFANLTELVNLDLHSNKIYGSQVAEDIFKENAILQDVDLSQNPLQSLNDRARNYGTLRLRTIERLNLANCYLSAIDGQLRDAIELRYLNLSNNFIKTMPNLNNLYALETLVIDGNPISPLGCAYYSYDTCGYARLKHLYASNMKMATSFSGFSNLQNLETLIMENNTRLGDTFDTATSDYKQSHPYLRHISLKNSRIMRLAEEALDWNNMDYINIQGNLLICDCKAKWLKTLKNLDGGYECADDNIVSEHNRHHYNPCSWWPIITMSAIYGGWTLAGIVALVVLIVVGKRVPRYYRKTSDFVRHTLAGRFVLKSSVTQRLLDDEEFMNKLKSKLLEDAEK